MTMARAVVTAKVLLATEAACAESTDEGFGSIFGKLLLTATTRDRLHGCGSSICAQGNDVTIRQSSTTTQGGRNLLNLSVLSG